MTNAVLRAATVIRNTPAAHALADESGYGVAEFGLVLGLLAVQCVAMVLSLTDWFGDVMRCIGAVL